MASAALVGGLSAAGARRRSTVPSLAQAVHHMERHKTLKQKGSMASATSKGKHLGSMHSIAEDGTFAGGHLD